MAKELPVEEVVISIPEGERICNICEGELKPIGRELVRRDLNFIPAQTFIRETYLEVFACVACEEEIVLFECRPNRSGEKPKAFLGGAKKFYLQTDGYAGYSGVENAVHCACWAHIVKLMDGLRKASRLLQSVDYRGARDAETVRNLRSVQPEACEPQNFSVVGHMMTLLRISRTFQCAILFSSVP
ncbi:MAG: IS66 family transposase [Oscillospiraceae bacterium]|nr:IS66 family transposase [Oscillospiraceae bacterium]